MSIVSRLINRPQSFSIEMLQRGVQNGTIPAYIGIPLIQEKLQDQKEMQGAQAAAMMGQSKPTPVAERVMAEASQANQPPRGVEALRSNLPAQFAAGGIVAFADGGDVERYEQGGSPAGRFFQDLSSKFGPTYAETQEAMRLREQILGKYGRQAGLGGVFMEQTDAQRQAAKNIIERLPKMTLQELRAVAGGAALPVQQAPTASVRMDANMADPRIAAAGLGPTPPKETVGYDAERARNMALVSAPPAAAPAAAPAVPGVPAFTMPNVQLPTYTPGTAPAAIDYKSFISKLPEEERAATEKAVKATKEELEAMDKPMFEKREERLGARSKQLAKDTEISRWLALMKGGFKAAQTPGGLGRALGAGGEEFASELIRGEAANRAAKDRLEDAQDNFEIQRAAAKKGNYQAAQSAGRQAASDIRAFAGLNMQAAQAGSQEAMQRYQATEQGKQFQAQQQQQGALGIAGLNLQAAQLRQQGAYQNAVLAQNEKKIAASNAATRARYAQVRTNALSKFDSGPGMQLNTQLAQRYGQNWRTGQDARSLEAQQLYNVQRQAYLLDALGQFELLDTTGGARSADSLLGGD